MSSPQLQPAFSLPPAATGEYRCQTNLPLYDSATAESLATEAARGRHLRLLSSTEESLLICLCEDGYQAWLPLERVPDLTPAACQYQAISLSRAEIERRLPAVIAFAKAAMARPNYYLWGGTVGPNYDCSGLMQAAFAASGIWLPRDSYQQAAFTQKIAWEEALPGDLIFFGTEKVNHVALYLGESYYLHSSGQEMGRNGIAIDLLSAAGDEISRAYYQKFWGCGRVMSSYQPDSQSVFKQR